ncbi:MAG: YggS family pyridoxal phosphate-dependent enzyme, partial [Bdellovibrionales bacterium]|nr:YggS family pyridoxal phosphate-dependent enzyme [Bdellovibrionales bacterium]
DLGENYLQEAFDKIPHFADKPINWHFIGTVQSKKVKQMLGLFELWHGVDRESVLTELSKRNSGPSQKILIQVNVAEEAAKSGLPARELLTFLESAQKLSGFSIHGLMTMPPLFVSEKMSRTYFAKLRNLLESSKKYVDTSLHPMKELSMGTSQDYTWAIQEGATIVRLGEVLVGPRESV